MICRRCHFLWMPRKSIFASRSIPITWLGSSNLMGNTSTRRISVYYFLSGWIKFFGIFLFSSGGIRKGFLRAHVGNFQLTPGGGQEAICVKKNGFYGGCRSTPNLLYFFLQSFPTWCFDSSVFYQCFHSIFVKPLVQYLRKLRLLK